MLQMPTLRVGLSFGLISSGADAAAVLSGRAKCQATPMWSEYLLSSNQQQPAANHQHILGGQASEKKKAYAVRPGTGVLMPAVVC